MLKGGRKAPFLIDKQEILCADENRRTSAKAQKSSDGTPRKPRRSTSPDPPEAADASNMPCYKPGHGRQAPGQQTVTYYGHLQIAAGKCPPLPHGWKGFPLPCGKCHGCKLERSRQTAVRLVHEAQLWKLTSFITLTYADKYLPTVGSTSQSLVDPTPLASGCPQRLDRRAQAAMQTHEIQEWGTLAPRDLQLFTKRLNEDVRRRSARGIKYYACGEYGDKTHRPHYHIAVFGEDFSDDRQIWKHSESGNLLWRSSRLQRLWRLGDADIGELTFESAAYIARYIMKKITGTKAVDHYKRVDREGNEYRLHPEFNRMSRGGRTGRGIAAEWFDQHRHDVYPHDHVISRGHPAKPPRYYDKLLEKVDPYLLQHLKTIREAEAQQSAADNTPARLEQRETVAIAKLSQSKRSLE